MSTVFSADGSVLAPPINDGIFGTESDVINGLCNRAYVQIYIQTISNHEHVAIGSFVR